MIKRLCRKIRSIFSPKKKVVHQRVDMAYSSLVRKAEERAIYLTDTSSIYRKSLPDASIESVYDYHTRTIRTIITHKTPVSCDNGISVDTELTYEYREPIP